MGFPYLHRLARDLVIDDRASPNRREAKLLRVFHGMAEFRAGRPAWQPRFRAEGYCNYALVDTEVMRTLANLARKMVLVTGFSTLDGLPAPFEDATVVEIPPHARSRGAGSRAFGSRILPEVMDEVTGHVGQLAGPGVLALICGGLPARSCYGLRSAVGLLRWIWALRSTPCSASGRGPSTCSLHESRWRSGQR